MASPVLERMEPVLLFLVETAYVYYVVLRLRKGVPRLLALVPLLPLSHLVAWRAPSPVERIICCVLFLWHAMFKLLLLAWDKGGLVSNSFALSSFPRFLSLNLSTYRLHQDPLFSQSKQEASLKRRDSESEEVVLSNGHEKSFSHSKQETDLRRRDSESEEIVLANGYHKSGAAAVSSEKNRSSQANGDTQNITAKASPGWLWRMVTSQGLHVVLIRDLPFNIVAISLLLWVLVPGKDVMSEYVIDLIIGLLTYFSIALLFDMAVVIPASVVGRKVEPVMDMPFAAVSLADFWGRRWNLVIINLSRVSVYEPMLKFLSRGKKRPSLLDRAISTQTVFLVSGLMHELALFYATKTKPSWEMMAFFVVNGIGTLVERLVMKKMQHSFEVPKFLRWAYTFTFLYLTGHWLFCPPIRAELLDGIDYLYVDGRWTLPEKFLAKV